MAIEELERRVQQGLDFLKENKQDAPDYFCFLIPSAADLMITDYNPTEVCGVKVIYSVMLVPNPKMEGVPFIPYWNKPGDYMAEWIYFKMGYEQN